MKIGDIVIVGTPQAVNGSLQHPGIVTKVTSDTDVDITVFPNNSEPIYMKNVGKAVDPLSVKEGEFQP